MCAACALHVHCKHATCALYTLHCTHCTHGTRCTALHCAHYAPSHARAGEHGLLQNVQTRVSVDGLSPLERLMHHKAGTVHEQMAAQLWDASSDADAVLAFTRLGESGALERAEAEGQAAAARETEELANLPSDKVERNQHRKREPVKRTPEEIVALRAERAAKRALTGAPPHDPNAGARR